MMLHFPLCVPLMQYKTMPFDVRALCLSRALEATHDMLLWTSTLRAARQLSSQSMTLIQGFGFRVKDGNQYFCRVVPIDEAIFQYTPHKTTY